jgi:leucyl-tRNA synthetase
MMSLVNDFYAAGTLTRADYETLLLLLNPVAPHMTEELTELIGSSKMACKSEWPKFDPAKTVEDTVEIGVQINGRLRGTVSVSGTDTGETVLARIREDAVMEKHFADMDVTKIIYVPKKIFNVILGNKK